MTILNFGYLVATGEQARDLEDRVDAIAKFVRDHSINDLWTQTYRQLRSEFNLPAENFWNSRHRMSRVDYDLRIEPNGDLYYSGSDNVGDHHSYSIPAAFLFAATRDEALVALREEFAAEKARLDADAEKTNAAQRARDEAEFERLGRELGKIAD